jgi:predicted component of type VI protein secretion system
MTEGKQAATMTKVHDGRFDVHQGRRVIGYIALFTINGESAWRFITNRRDISDRFHPTAPKHASADDALAYVNRMLG